MRSCQFAQGGPGEEAFRGRRARGGAGRPAGVPPQPCAQGRRRVRGAPGGSELRHAARGACAVVVAAAGRPCSRAWPYRRRVPRDGAAGSEKNCLKPWQRVGWVIPPQGNADFAAAMEKVLDVYRRPCDATFPVVCMDEIPWQLIGETRQPVAMGRHGKTTNTGAAAPAMSSSPRNPGPAGA